MEKKPPLQPHATLPKSPTGITGLDEIAGRGLPSGRPSLVRGAVHLGEPGEFMMIEENARELTANARSLGFNLDRLEAQKKILLDHVHIERSKIEETGEYDLEGLLVRLRHAIDSSGAQRMVHTRWRRFSPDFPQD